MTDTDDIEAAWSEGFDALPAGRSVGRPSYYPERREWQQYAFDSFEVAKVGVTELACMREMAPCLREIGAGRTPQ